MWCTLMPAVVFAYVPPSDTLCSIPDISCNNETGVNIDRATFDFSAGVWTQVMLFTWLNNPTSHANGLFQFLCAARVAIFCFADLNISLNGQQVVYLDQLQIRAGSGITTDGLWFEYV